MNAKVQLILELKERIKAGLSSAKKAVNQTVQEMKDKLASLKTSHIETFKAMGDQIPGFSSAMSLLGNPYVLVTAGVLALGGAYIKAVSMASDWEHGLAKVNVTAQLSAKELAKLSDQVLTIGENNVTPLAEVPDAFNKIISAGLDVKTSLASLDPILKATKAGFSDVGTVAAATVSVMNSTGIMSAKDVLDVLFATVNKGNAEFSNIAQYLPRIIPMANAAGISFKDMAGAFAYLTAQGFRSEQAATGLENAFKSFSNPATVKGLKSIGVSVYDTQGKMKPLLALIGDLKKRLNGLSDRKRGIELGKVNFDVESKAAIFAMMGDYGKLKDIIDFTNNSQGQLNQSIDNAKTSTDSWSLILNKAEGFFIQLGQSALPILNSVGNWFLNNGPILEGFVTIIGSMAAAWGVYALITNAAAIANGVFTAAMWLLDAAMDANPVGIIVLAIGALIGGLITAYKHSEKFRAVLSGLGEIASDIGGIFKGLGEMIWGALTFDVDTITKGWHDMASSFEDVGSAFGRGYDESMKQSKIDALKEQKEKTGDAFAGVKGKDGKQGKPGKLDNSGGDSVNKITNGSKQVRNITVNIDAFNKGGINVSNTKGLQGMSAGDIEKWFNEMLMRALINLEANQN